MHVFKEIDFFFLSKYTFIRFVTSCNKGSLVSWNGGGGGGTTLNRRVLLGGRVALGKGLAFLGF